MPPQPALSTTNKKLTATAIVASCTHASATKTSQNSPTNTAEQIDIMRALVMKTRRRRRRPKRSPHPPSAAPNPTTPSASFHTSSTHLGTHPARCTPPPPPPPSRALCRQAPLSSLGTAPVTAVPAISSRPSWPPFPSHPHQRNNSAAPSLGHTTAAAVHVPKIAIASDADTYFHRGWAHPPQQSSQTSNAAATPITSPPPAPHGTSQQQSPPPPPLTTTCTASPSPPPPFLHHCHCRRRRRRPLLPTRTPTDVATVACHHRHEK
ncbi:hypothetical protein I4F81_003516 [Pyropia yezoensis]|uniref:Uncharacterized protein n=1 Tax=Pyropia yezoensis TaxID=2788 RepID=A0ACC3BT52_PYRYE|nr:hypothetical protein I4F81_003516 [Neopyropia yezoensis]